MSLRAVCLTGNVLTSKVGGMRALQPEETVKNAIDLRGGSDQKRGGS